jgi:uncharacterized protein (TIGR02444 family)
MIQKETEAGSQFWRFSLCFYRQPGVGDACIALQDGCGVDVNVLLFLLWLASGQRRVPPDVMPSLCARTAAWRDDVVVPLRTLRRRLKDGSALVAGGTVELFRTRIKAVELEAERLQQEALFALAAGLPTVTAPSVEAAARANVAAYEQILACRFAAEPVEVLITTVNGIP